MEKLVAVTYWDDLPQFEIMLAGLNQHWQGNRHISIAYTVNNNNLHEIKNQIKEIANAQLKSNWTVEFFDFDTTLMSGYDEQQVFKILLSLDSEFEDSIVLDSKDFLLKSADITDFKVEEKYKIMRTSAGGVLNDMYPRVVSDLNITEKIIDPILILTPWIWNQKQLEKYWIHLLEKFGDWTTWTNFPTGSEWAGYYSFTFLDHDKNIELVTKENPQAYWMPIAGNWKNQTEAEVLVQEKEFDSYPERKFWKNHRDVANKDLKRVTARVLKTHGINPALVEGWLQKN